MPPNPSELLYTKRMEDVLAQAQERADLVLIDSPPVLAVSDAVVLAQKVDGVLLMVNAGRTRREVAQRALENLRHVGANVVGAILNAVSTGRGKSYHYYYAYGQKKVRRWRLRLPWRKRQPPVASQAVARKRVAADVE
jgi:capsular exopolysaccharide synthesis family protein